MNNYTLTPGTFFLIMLPTNISIAVDLLVNLVLWFIGVNQLQQINWGGHEYDDHQSDRWIFLKGKIEKKKTS